MIRRYAVPLMAILEAVTLSSQQPFPYGEIINFFSEKKVNYIQLGGRRIMTDSKVPSPETQEGTRPIEISFLYQRAQKIDERMFIACKGSIEPAEESYKSGTGLIPLMLGIISARCYIDGGGYGNFDEKVDAVLLVDTRRHNVAQHLDSLNAFRKIPPEEQEAATKEQREWLERMMNNYR